MGIYIATYSLDIVALIYLLSMLNSGTSLNRDRKIPFIISIVLTIVIILAEAVTILADNENINLRSINILFNIIGFSLTPLIPMAITLILDKRSLTAHKLLFVPTFINIVAAILSPFFNLIFYVDDNNVYKRGQFFFIFIVVYLCNYFILVICTLDIGVRNHYPIRRKIMTLFLFTMIGTSIQLIKPTIYSSWHCITLTIFIYFLMMSEFDSSFDTLSGLYNRATLDRVVKGLAKTKKLMVIVMDIDDFKKINDNYGHDYGDCVIKQISTIIRESFGKQYKWYRLGGDEFVVLSEDTDQNKIDSQLDRMTKTLSETMLKGHMLPTVSYGYSSNQSDEILDFNKILNEADERMYQNKRASISGSQ